MRKLLAWSLRLLITLLVLFVAGYLSDYVSTSACEQQVARWVVQDVMRGQEFHVLPTAPRESLPILQKAGGRVRLLQLKEGQLVEFPWAEVGQAKIKYPYVVTVNWGFCHAPLSGQGGERRFLCLFSYVIRLGDRSRWVT